MHKYLTGFILGLMSLGLVITTVFDYAIRKGYNINYDKEWLITFKPVSQNEKGH